MWLLMFAFCSFLSTLITVQQTLEEVLVLTALYYPARSVFASFHSLSFKVVLICKCAVSFHCIFPGLYQPNFGGLSSWICGGGSRQRACYSTCGLGGLLPGIPYCLLPCYLPWPWAQQLRAGAQSTWRGGSDWRKDHWPETGSAEPQRQLEGNGESLCCLSTKQSMEVFAHKPTDTSCEDYIEHIWCADVIICAFRRSKDKKVKQRNNTPLTKVWEG